MAVSSVNNSDRAKAASKGDLGGSTLKTERNNAVNSGIVKGDADRLLDAAERDYGGSSLATDGLAAHADKVTVKNAGLSLARRGAMSPAAQVESAGDYDDLAEDTAGMSDQSVDYVASLARTIRDRKLAAENAAGTAAEGAAQAATAAEGGFMETARAVGEKASAESIATAEGSTSARSRAMKALADARGTAAAAPAAAAAAPEAYGAGDTAAVPGAKAARKGTGIATTPLKTASPAGGAAAAGAPASAGSAAAGRNTASVGNKSVIPKTYSPFKARIREMQVERAAGAAAEEAAGAGAGAAKGASSLFAEGSIGATLLPILAVCLGLMFILVIFLVVLGGASESNHGFNTEGMSENEAAIARYLHNLGWENVQIAAALGNFVGESGAGIDPAAEAYGPHGDYGIGFMMWTDYGSTRNATALKNYAASRNRAWQDIDVQLDFLFEDYWSARDEEGRVYFFGSYRTSAAVGSMDPPPGTKVTGSSKTFFDTDDVLTAVENFCYGAERPSHPNIEARYNAARGFIEILNRDSGGEIVDLPGGEQFGDPCPTASTSSGFGYRSFDNSFHKGTDMAAPNGTPYYAAASGTVLYATNGGGWNGGAGNWVVIDHGNGWVTKYMHSSVTFVTPGQQVKRGQHIGNVGETGQAYGAHLHFQVEHNGEVVDPNPLIGR